MRVGVLHASRDWPDGESIGERVGPCGEVRVRRATEPRGSRGASRPRSHGTRRRDALDRSSRLPPRCSPAALARSARSKRVSFANDSGLAPAASRNTRRRCRSLTPRSRRLRPAALNNGAAGEGVDVAPSGWSGRVISKAAAPLPAVALSGVFPPRPRRRRYLRDEVQHRRPEVLTAIGAGHRGRAPPRTGGGKEWGRDSPGFYGEAPSYLCLELEKNRRSCLRRPAPRRFTRARARCWPC
jgi:hypothetical protein